MIKVECTKLTFETFSEAQSVVNKARNRKRWYVGEKRVNRGATKKPKRVYKCEQCGYYHLTSQKKKHD